MTDSKCGFITVLGASNAGKSTLVNALVGTKVSIVSPKVQTTRFKIRGILNQDNSQIIFIDTPGIFKPSKRLEKAMVQNAWEDSETSDLCLLVVDASKGVDKTTHSIIDTLAQHKYKAVLVLNKIDLISKEKLLPLIKEFNHLYTFKETFLISALQKKNLQELKSYLLENIPKSVWYFPENQLTDISDRLFCSEITREKIFLYLQQEIPYSIHVNTLEFKENDKAITIKQDIIVERASQKTIILGKNGQMIKKIGTAARHELQYILEKKVNLFLFVQVNKNWMDEKQNYTQMGLNFNVKN